MKRLIAVGGRIHGEYKVALEAQTEDGKGTKIIKAKWPGENKDEKKS